jgi:high-affinity Fe2+/Pb2+ permease
MWDRKRQIIWLATGLLFGTFFLYPLAVDETTGRLDLTYFLQLEALLLLVICVMFYVYGRKG